MVMAAGLGTRLRPLTWEIPKPAVPVANRPVIEHILRGLRAHGIEQVVSNLHWFPETIRGPLGDGSQLGIELTYSYEEELLGTAGGVRNVADWLSEEGESFLVMAGDALTDIDFTALIRAHERLRGRRHARRQAGPQRRASTAWSSQAPTAASRASRKSPTRRRRSRTWPTA